MVAKVGRKVIISRNGTPLASCRTKTVTINNEPIDITSDDDDGYRRLLDTDPAQSSVEISVEGIMKDTTLLADAVGRSNLMSDLVIDIDGVYDFGGQFYLSSFEVGAPYNDGTTFSATFMSAGEYSNEST